MNAELPKNGPRMGAKWARIGKELATIGHKCSIVSSCTSLLNAIFGYSVMEHGGGLQLAGKVDLEVLSTNPVSKAALRGQETPKRGKTDG